MTEERKQRNTPAEVDEEALREILESEPDPADEEWAELPPGEDFPEDTSEEECSEEDLSEEDPAEEDLSDVSEKDAAKLEKELTKAEKGLKYGQRFLIYLIAFLAVAWVLFFKVIGITHMPTEDMEPRIDGGDLLVFYRLDKDAAFQDVIIFEKEVDGRKMLLVGRVMAAPGDTVDINANHQLVVNGNVIVEEAIYYSSTYKRGDRVSYPLTLEEGQYFVLTDNRDTGVDSRYFGPVSRDEVLGTVIMLFRRNKL